MLWSFNDVDTTSPCDKFDRLFVITRSISVDDVLVICNVFKPFVLALLINYTFKLCIVRWVVVIDIKITHDNCFFILLHNGIQMLLQLIIIIFR